MTNLITFNELMNQLLADKDLTDICINSKNKIFVDRGNGMEPLDVPISESDPHLWIIQNLSRAGLSFDAKNPFVDFQLPTRHRVHALFPPCSPEVIISIRRPAQSEAKTDRWTVNRNSLYWDLLKQAAIEGDNILIAGATGSGKTTLLNDLLSQVPSKERIIALEDVNELAPIHPHFLSLLSHRPNADGFGAITLRTLLTQALRMRPDRIIIGECRGTEVLDFLQILNTGHKGAMATIHAESCRDALYRLELLCLLSGHENLSTMTIKTLISRGIRWIAHTKRNNATGQREIVEIQQVVGCESGTILLRPVLNSVLNDGTDSTQRNHSRIF
jgi:pilus assembly protein CpaF